MPARGRVFKRRGCWYYYVLSGRGYIVLADDTADYATIVQACIRDVAAVRRLEGAGHKLRPYRQLVDEAAAFGLEESGVLALMRAEWAKR